MPNRDRGLKGRIKVGVKERRNKKWTRTTRTLGIEKIAKFSAKNLKKGF